MNSDEQAIRQLVATWLAATKAGDTATILRMVADDVVFLTAGAPPMRGKAAFAASLAGLAGMDIDAVSDIAEIRILGDWAWLWTKLTVVVTPPGGGAPVRREGSALTILRKDAGGWVIVRDANMLAPATA
jgi:uncharacterized protein (TIGR02246 family)